MLALTGPAAAQDPPAPLPAPGHEAPLPALAPRSEDLLPVPGHEAPLPALAPRSEDLLPAPGHEPPLPAPAPPSESSLLAPAPPPEDLLLAPAPPPGKERLLLRAPAMPAVSAPDGEADVLQLDLLLDRLGRLEIERRHGLDEAWRGLVWLGLSLAMSGLGYYIAAGDDVDLPLSLSWALCGVSGALLGIHLSRQGLTRYHRAEEELQRLDDRLAELPGGR